MKLLDITPDGYIGHSVGELGCAYMDGCFTAEETLLAAYYRGLASNETELIPGYMAAIAPISYDSLSKDFCEEASGLFLTSCTVVSGIFGPPLSWTSDDVPVPNPEQNSPCVSQITPDLTVEEEEIIAYESIEAPPPPTPLTPSLQPVTFSQGQAQLSQEMTQDSFSPRQNIPKHGHCSDKKLNVILFIRQHNIHMLSLSQNTPRTDCLGYKDVKDLCPPEIDVACHNSSSSSTISGPEEIVKTFVKQLQKDNIFARAVNVANIAYHSRYIRPAAPKLLEYLKKVSSIQFK
uniref:(California timema) hypothetical protein n=1 Tax=Timema californicum TaxID=61474 RepID=A0A7R9JBX5_TIMCA|nr:unnamed protein product [Timema californicum]